MLVGEVLVGGLRVRCCLGGRGSLGEVWGCTCKGEVLLGVIEDSLW